MVCINYSTPWPPLAPKDSIRTPLQSPPGFPFLLLNKHTSKTTLVIAAMATRVTYADSGCLQSLPLVSTTLKSHIVDLTVSHTLTQVYNNSSTRDISEAHYTFPLYESSSVTDFQALVGEKIIRGVVKERAEAKAIYEATKSAGKVTALFSQDTSEVFTTSVGNIPADNSVVVVIKYVHELKQDIEVDGVKLVIPTIIAPKYGTRPQTTGLIFGAPWRTCWNTFSRNILDIGSAEGAGLSLSVTATMSGPIRGVTSPSHPISIGLGSHSISDDALFDPMKAHATLAIASRSLTSLDKDFSLLVSTNNISQPRAFLAPHPTLKDTSTLMVTIAPRFALPPQGHEVIFVVDRSGSMVDKIATVRSALQLFLASLPMGLYFNICSFGSHHSFLWPQSQVYSEASLNMAKGHVVGMDSNMGGTEILSAVIDTIKTRRSGMRTEILILTDGEVWDAEGMFRFIGESSKDGSVRFFSLGVGDTVSHSLVEGISRAGRGYSQIVNIAGNLQKKVMRMLKAALTPHVNDWDIDWAGKPEKRLATLTTPAPRTVAPISLFDLNCDPDNTPLVLPSSALALTLPEVVQAPTIVPALFSYSRTTVYFLISNGDRPEKVFLRGSAHVANSNTTHPLETEIPVQEITSTGASLGLYQLAGRKLLQDLEEGRLSYLEGIYDRTEEPIKHAELIAKEGARVGVEFGLASKWTSFVAVEEDESTREGLADHHLGERTDVPVEGEAQAINSRSTGSSSRGAAAEQANQRLEERTNVRTKGETRAAKAGSASSSSSRLSKPAPGSVREAKRASTSPKLQSKDYIYQQKQEQQAQMRGQQQQEILGGGRKGSGAPYKVSGSDKITRGTSLGDPQPPPSSQAFAQSSGPSGHPTERARTGSGSFSAEQEPSRRPVPALRKKSLVKLIPPDGEGLKLVVEASASVSPSRSQNLSSPTFNSSSGVSPSSPHGSPPTSRVFAPTSPRKATARYSATSPPHSPTHRPRAHHAVRDSHSLTSPQHSPTTRPPRACCAARGSHSTTSLSQSPAPRPQACRTVHPVTSPPHSSAPEPQVCLDVRDSHSASSPPHRPAPPQLQVRIAQDSHIAISLSHSPAPQPQTYYVTQDPLDNSFTSGSEDNLQSSSPPVQHCQQQESQSTQKESHNPVSDLATLPKSDGMFKADRRIFDWLGLQNCGLENAHADVDFVATVAVIVALEKKFPELLEEWEFMVSKAKEAVQKLYSEGDREAVVSAVRAALGG